MAVMDVHMHREHPLLSLIRRYVPPTHLDLDNADFEWATIPVWAYTELVFYFFGVLSRFDARDWDE